MPITRLPESATHIGLVVPDIEKARQELLALYGPLPGLDFVYDFFPDTVWGPDGKALTEKCQLRICMIEWIPGLKMELLQPMMGATEHDRFARIIGGGMHHVAYYVKEHFPEYRALLLSQGAQILFECETEDDRGYRRCCYLRCPSTNMIYEIAEPPKPFPKAE